MQLRAYRNCNTIHETWKHSLHVIHGNSWDKIKPITYLGKLSILLGSLVMAQVEDDVSRDGKTGRSKWVGPPLINMVGRGG